MVDLSGVGENLIDQTNHVQAFNSSLEPSNTSLHVFVTAADLFGDDLTSIEASTRESIPEWAQAIVEASGEGILDVTAIETQLSLQHDLIFKQGVTLAEIMTVGTGEGDSVLFGCAYWNLLPFARGSVHLKSADEIDAPVIDPRFFLVDFDLEATVSTGKMARKFWNSAPISDFVSGQLVPESHVLPEKATDEQWASFHQDTGGPSHITSIESKYANKTQWPPTTTP